MSAPLTFHDEDATTEDGRALEGIRKELSLPMGAFALALGVDESTYRRWVSEDAGGPPERAVPDARMFRWGFSHGLRGDEVNGELAMMPGYWTGVMRREPGGELARLALEDSPFTLPNLAGTTDAPVDMVVGAQTVAFGIFRFYKPQLDDEERREVQE